MTEIDIILKRLKEDLKSNAPKLTPQQIQRRNKILNSEDPKFQAYGLKISEIEKIVKDVKSDLSCTFEEAVKVFQQLMPSHIHEEKFAGIFFLNLFKKFFNKEIIQIFHDSFIKYCDSWSICDSTMIRVVGPYLGKKGNQELAFETIESWSNSENMWIRRASMVILLKIIMIRKEFNSSYIFNLINKALQSHEDYIQKVIGWLLKTCLRYDEKGIIEYLEKNKKRLPRLILRYASEKLPKDIRRRILQK